ncbi:MAG: AMP-binding protein [Candidatus Eisenbacteria bacterium]|nr:AMP-binding protein [Candidatus Eisenbacteria bacterium]
MKSWLDRIYESCPVALQNALVSLYGRRIFRQRFGPGFDSATELLKSLERAPLDSIREYQNERLRKIVEHAYATVPYYGRRWRSAGVGPDDIRAIDDLEKLPVLTRQEVIDNREDLVSTAADRGQLRLATTSGTTGYPVSVYWDRGVTVMNNACLWRARSWGGAGFGRPYATLMGREIVPRRQTEPPYWRYNSTWNQLLLSSYHLDEETAPLYVDRMREAGVDMLEAYPSAAYLLARYMEMRSLTLPLRSVLTSSEPLLPVQRALIESRFECRVMDAYGQAERVAFASECERHEGLHIFEGYGIVELLDDDLEPVPEGGAGQIVATGLHNMAMPLIRYATGDGAVLARERCSCGRALRLLTGITGKAEDIVVTPGGRMIPGPLLSYALKGISGVVRSQLVQERPETLTVRLVVNEDFLPRDEDLIRKGLTERLGDEVTLRFDYVSEIELSGRAKYRWIISSVPLRWGELSTSNLYEGGEAD